MRQYANQAGTEFIIGADREGEHTMELVIKEVGRNSYVIPSIDNRRRGGAAMWRIITDTYGTKIDATLHTQDGRTELVWIDAMGWRVLNYSCPL